ncbi:MAG: hypothetical protein KZQ94_07535 [Candidatus Thiodiazotropha sp. (ex Troendleina suluensis)]|nr:hypothetical protein [Candidatus Thiodiazotropha sp. (ex Troendleina suluensis)]
MQLLLETAYYRIGIALKNTGTKSANRVTLKIKPIQETMPDKYTFSTNEHITRESTPDYFEKELNCGSINVGEEKNEFSQFFLNYRYDTGDGDSVRNIADIEFEYYLTCDDNEPSSGKLKIVNA